MKIRFVMIDVEEKKEIGENSSKTSVSAPLSRELPPESFLFPASKQPLEKRYASSVSTNPHLRAGGSSSIMLTLSSTGKLALQPIFGDYLPNWLLGQDRHWI